jgi:hypothetical protein
MKEKYRVYNTSYKKYIETETTVNGKKIISLSANPEYKDFIVEPQTAVVEKHGPEYYIVRNKNGKGIDTSFVYKQSIKKIKEQVKIETVDNNLINKINTKITLANTIDGQFLRNLVNFINREKPTLPIDAIMSLITHCLTHVTSIESQLNLIKDSGMVEFMNKMKIDDVSKIPNSIWQSFVTGNIFRYLKIKICNEIQLLGSIPLIGSLFQDNTKANLEKVRPFC